MTATFKLIQWVVFMTVWQRPAWAQATSGDANTICAKGSPRMNDAARMLMLDNHNSVRLNMIKGKEAISASGALSPTGSNMSGTAKRSAKRKHGWTCTPKELFFGRVSDAFRSWSQRLRTNGWNGASNRTFTSADDWVWAQLVWAKTYSMGCGISSNGKTVLCHYGPRGVYAGQLVYPAGTPCTSDSQCTTGVGDKCSVDEGLCLRGASPVAHLTCPRLGGHTSDAVRATMLDLHNNLRRELANGQTKNKTGLLPTGKNIYKLVGFVDRPVVNTGFNHRTMTANWRRPHSRPSTAVPRRASAGTRGEITEEELLTKWKANVQKLWDDVTLYGVDKDITPHANITNTWQHLATNRITKMGCGMLRSPGVSKMCPSASNRLDDASRLRLLDLHNHRRSELIHGREDMGNTYTFAPTGSNMYKMVWDCAAEAKSQAWIEDAVGRIPHSTNEYRTYSGDQYSESLYMYVGTMRPARDAVELAINWWWGELAEIGWYGAGNHTLTRADADNTEQHETITHWSNAAWAKTFKLGCGISKGGFNVCCQYGPGGNYVNQAVYPPGQPCAKDADCTRSPLDKCNAADGLCLHA
ncbi:venom allergen-like protein vap-2 [Aphelenchoides avenae]|nr:venom allergen-like protein vap-2 [Aphelenchus avenae]